MIDAAAIDQVFAQTRELNAKRAVKLAAARRPSFHERLRRRNMTMVADFCLKGRSYDEIAARRGLTKDTVSSHVQSYAHRIAVMLHHGHQTAIGAALFPGGVPANDRVAELFEQWTWGD